MASDPKVVSVLVDLKLNQPLDYALPQTLQAHVRRGMQVTVPVRGKLRTGYVLEVKQESPFPNLLPLHSLDTPEPLLTDEIFELALWIHRYYNAPLQQVLKTVLPAPVRHLMGAKEQFFVKLLIGKEKARTACTTLRASHPERALVLDELLKAPEGLLLSELIEKAGVSKSPIETLKKQGVLQVEKIRLDRMVLDQVEYFKTAPKVLNEEQQEAYRKITEALSEKKFQTHLLHGVTGSGKTEVYLQAIDFALKKGLGTLMLIPEIALTGQTIERFRSRFDVPIAIMHHRLSQGERYDTWHKIRNGEVKIVLGARSTLFCPVQNLGLIIVDEEHDSAYKQSEESPCYHARDVAVMRGKFANAVVMLGSATPSLESYYNALSGKYHLSTLKSRTRDATLPKVHLLDMKNEYEKAGGFTLFSSELIDQINSRLEKGEQSILFLNRRGYHTSLQCKGCGYIFNCPSCSVALTLHKGESTLACHLCDFKQSAHAVVCPECKDSQTLKYTGVGTEQVERAVNALFPQARTLRIDGDTTRHKGSHERLFRSFSTQKADILIGTQMITKGLHFPAVTLVAILNSDGGLHIPDFRASERTFQLITQVAGRSGRGELKGEVILQTCLPENLTLKQGAEQAFEAFYASEIASRELFGFPPFTHLVKLTFSGEDSSFTQEVASRFREALARNLPEDYHVHPLLPSGYAKIKNRYRFQCLIRGKNVSPINHVTSALLAHAPLPREIKLHIDVDPLSTYF